MPLHKTAQDPKAGTMHPDTSQPDLSPPGCLSYSNPEADVILQLPICVGFNGM